MAHLGGSYETNSSQSENSFGSDTFCSVTHIPSESTPITFESLLDPLSNISSLDSNQYSSSGRKTPLSRRRISSEAMLQTPKSSSRPNLSYSQMIRDVLLEHGRLTTKDICKRLSEKYPQNFSLDKKKWQVSLLYICLFIYLY